MTEAIDRQLLVSKVLGGMATPASRVPSHRSSWAYSAPDASKYPYNLAAAKKLLGDAGWTTGFVATGLLSGRNGIDFSVTLDTADAYPYL